MIQRTGTPVNGLAARQAAGRRLWDWLLSDETDEQGAATPGSNQPPARDGSTREGTTNQHDTTPAGGSVAA